MNPTAEDERYLAACLEKDKENKIPAKKGGQVAKNARLELEQKTGKKVVGGKNFKQLPNALQDAQSRQRE